MIALLASSILNPLCSNEMAPFRMISAAAAKFSLLAGLSLRKSSASKTRHGRCATPPTAILASLMRSFSSINAVATETSVTFEFTGW